MARQIKPPQSGAKRSGSAPGKRKIGGDLQGEPIFRLSGPAAALQVPNPRPCSRTDTPENLGRLLIPITNLLERFPEPAPSSRTGPFLHKVRYADSHDFGWILPRLGFETSKEQRRTYHCLPAEQTIDERAGRPSILENWIVRTRLRHFVLEISPSSANIQEAIAESPRMIGAPFGLTRMRDGNGRHCGPIARTHKAERTHRESKPHSGESSLSLAKK